MTEVFVVEADWDDTGRHELVGVYSSADKAVEASYAHKDWMQSGYDYIVTCLPIDSNNTRVIVRYSPFILRKGSVPSWFLRQTKYKEAFEL